MGVIEDPQQWRDVTGSSGAIEMRFESGSMTCKPRLLALVNEQLGPMNGRWFLPRSSFFRRMSGRNSIRLCARTGRMAAHAGSPALRDNLVRFTRHETDEYDLVACVKYEKIMLTAYRRACRYWLRR